MLGSVLAVETAWDSLSLFLCPAPPQIPHFIPPSLLMHSFSKREKKKKKDETIQVLEGNMGEFLF